MADSKELTVKLLMDIQDLKAQLSQMNNSISKSMKDASNSTNSFGNTLKSIGKWVSAGYIAKKLFDIGAQAVKTAGQFEQFNVAFSTMLGSSQKAKVLMEDIKKFAATTPFELPEVVSGAKQLLAYGFAAEEIIPTMTTLGNISAGLGVPISRLNLVFGQVRASGRLMGQDLLQFTNAGVPMIEALSKVLGVSTTAVKDMVSAGKVGFKEVQEALQNLGGEGGKFGGLMIAQSKTVGGIFSNISDTFTQVSLEIGNALLPIIKYLAIHFLNALQKIQSWVVNNREKITGFFINLFTVIQIVVEALVKLGRFLWEKVIKPIADFIGSLKIFQKFAKKMDEVTGFTEKKTKTQEEITSLTTTENIERNITTTGGEVGGGGTSFQTIYTQVVGDEKVTETFAKIGTSFSEQVVQGIMAGTLEMDVVLQNWANSVYEMMLMNLFQPLSAGMGMFALEMQTMFNETFGLLLNPIMMFVGQGIAMFGSMIKNFILQTLGFQKLFSTVTMLLGQAWTAMSNTMIMQWLMAIAVMIWNFITMAAGMIFGFALIAASAAASAVALIPIIGPILAPLAYIATFALVIAGVAKLAGIGLAQGTPEVIGGSNTDTVPAMLTPGEMVVPKSMAEGVRSGDVVLGAGETQTQATTSNNIGVNMDGATFNGSISNEMAYNIGEQIALGIKNNIIAPMPA